MFFPRVEKMWQRLRAFMQDESGATAIEYAIIASGLSIVIVAAVNGIGTKLANDGASLAPNLRDLILRRHHQKAA
jgi:pilus assembly protein Flp/PilA